VIEGGKKKVKEEKKEKEKGKEKRKGKEERKEEKRKPSHWSFLSFPNLSSPSLLFLPHHIFQNGAP